MLDSIAIFLVSVIADIVGVDFESVLGISDTPLTRNHKKGSWSIYLDPYERASFHLSVEVKKTFAESQFSLSNDYYTLSLTLQELMNMSTLERQAKIGHVVSSRRHGA